MSYHGRKPSNHDRQEKTMATAHFNGVIPPVLTPFREPTSHVEPAVDEQTLRRQVDRLINAGVDGLFALGSSAEAAFLTRNTRRNVISTVVDQAGGRVPVTVGVIDMTTPRVAEHVSDAVDCGAEGIVATAPFYVRTHRNEILRHFKYIHELAPDLPLFAYNIPVSTHTTLDIEMLLELASEGVLQGVKDSGGSDAYTRALVEGRTERGLSNFSILTGSETTVDMAYLAGADGVVPGLGNVDPVAYVEMADTLRAGDYSKAVAQQQRINRLFEITSVGDQSRIGGSSAGLGSFKAALEHIGVFPNHVMAPPHEPLNDAEIRRIKDIVDKADIREPTA